MESVLLEAVAPSPAHVHTRKKILFIGLSAPPPPSAAYRHSESCDQVTLPPHDSARVGEELAALLDLFSCNADVAAAFELFPYPFGNSIDDLLRLVAYHRPHVLHISGHTREDGGLFFETSCEFINPAALGERIRGLGVEGVVLNGCGMAAALEAIVHSAGPSASVEGGAGPWFAVGHSTAVRVVDARRFACTFYAELGRTGRIDAAVSAVRSPLTAADQSVVHLEYRARPPPFFVFPAPVVDEDAYAAAIRRTYGKMLQLADALHGSGGDGTAFRQLGLADVFVPPTVQLQKEKSATVVTAAEAAARGFSLAQAASLVESGQLGAWDASVRPASVADASSLEGQTIRLNPAPPPPSGALPSLLHDTPHLRRSVILGDAGSGKSSSLRMYALFWATKAAADARAALPLPLLVELRQFAEHLRGAPASDFVDFLACGGSVSCRMDPTSLRARLALPYPHVLLLLDGLDEVFEDALRDAVIRAVRELRCYDGLSVVVTSRIIGYRRSWLSEWGYAHYRIQPLMETQVDEFITRWHFATYETVESVIRDSRAARLRAALRSVPQLRELSRNPLLLTMIAIVNRRPEDLPSRRVGILEDCARLLVHRWRVDDAIAKARVLSLVNVQAFDFDRKAALLADLAWVMQGGGEHGGSDGTNAGNLIQRTALHRLLEKHAAAAFAPPAAAFEILKQLHDHHGVLSFLGGTSYSFVHRSFLEYFCARRVAELIEDREWGSAELSGWFSRLAANPAWADTLALVCGIVPSGVAGPSLSALVDAGQTLLAGRCVEQLRDRRKAEPHVGRVRDELLRAIRSATCSRRERRRHAMFEHFYNQHETAAAACNLVASLWHDDTTRDAFLGCARDATHSLSGLATLRLLQNWSSDAVVNAHAVSVSALCINRCKLGEPGARALAQGLRSVPLLRRLDLSLNSLDDAGARSLAEGLHSVPQLQRLDLSYNGLGEAGARSLAQGLRSVPLLQRLDLSNNRFGEAGARTLAEGLRSIPQLCLLNISCSYIRYSGTHALAESLRFVPQLQFLDLSWNELGGAGARALAEGLRFVPLLRHLDLQRNELDNAGAHALAESLRSVPQLQFLDLSGNRLDVAGARALAEGLRSVPMLRRLNLSDIGLCWDSARAFDEVLRSAAQLLHLKVWLGNRLEFVVCSIAERRHIGRDLSRFDLLSMECRDCARVLAAVLSEC